MNTATGDILKVLNTSLNKGLKANHIVFDKSTIADSKITDLFNDLLGVDNLSISGVKDISINNSVLLLNAIDSQKGLTTEIYAIPVTLASVQFTEVNNQLRLKFSTKEIKTTLLALVKAGVIPGDETAYPNLSLPGAVFTFDSGYTVDTPTDPNIQTAIIPSFGVVSKIENPGLNFPIHVSNQVLNYAITGGSDSAKRYSLLANCQINLPSNTIIDASISLPIGAFGWSFDINTEKNQILSLADFIKLFGNIMNDKSLDLKGMIPESLSNIIDDVGLKFLTVSLDNKLKLSAASFTISINKSWNILRDIVSLNKGFELSLTLSRDSSGSLVSYGSVDGNAILGKNLQTSISIPIPISSGLSTISSNPFIPLKNLKDLQDLLPGCDLVSVLPKELFGDINDLVLTDLELDFSFVAPIGIKHFKFGLTSSNPWTLPFNSSLSNIELNLEIDQDNSKKYQVIANIRANFTFGPMGTEIDVALIKTADNSTWRLHILSEDIVLPHLSAFADFMGDQKLKDLLPANSDQLSNVVISDLGLNLDGAKLLDFSFGLAYAEQAQSNAWEIIPGKLIIKDFSIYFQVLNNNKDVNEIYGHISGIMDMEGLDLFLSAEYTTTGWSFTGKLEDVDFKAIQKSSLFDFQLPSSLPDLIIQDIDITINSHTSDCHFSCLGSFAIEQKKIDTTLLIDYTSINKTYKFSGTFKIGTSDFELSFGNDGSSTKFSAEWQNNNTGLKLNEIVKDLEVDTSIIPTVIDLDFKKASIFYDSSSKVLLFIASFESGGALLMALLTKNALPLPKYLFVLHFNKDLSLLKSLIGLLGSSFKPEVDIIARDLQFLGVNNDFANSDIESIKALMPSQQFILPKQITKGLSMVGSLNIGDTPMLFNVQD